MSDYQKRIATLLDEINKKTHEVERLTKEETCLIEKEEDNNNCSELIVVLTEIVSAAEHYEATQSVVIEAQKILDAMAIDTLKIGDANIIEAQKLVEQFDCIDTWWLEVFSKNVDYVTTKTRELATAFSKTRLEGKEAFYCSVKEVARLTIDLIKDGNFPLNKATPEKKKTYNTMHEKLEKLEKIYKEVNEPMKTLQEAKLKESDARQKYESTLRKLFKPYLIEALTNIEWKRANSEMIDVMLNQISVLQTMYQQEIKARDVMLNQISVLQTWYQQETKAREEKRITNVWKFRLFYAGLGIGAILLMNYNFNYPFINVSAPTGYLAMY